MSYRLNRVHLLICIFAGLVLAGGFVWHIFFGLPFSLFVMTLWVSLAIVMFYFIGLIARSILVKDVFAPNEEDYDLSNDEEYLAFMESLETENAAAPDDIMLEEPMETVDIAFDDSEQGPA